jgi:hypothetical protein
MKTEYRKKHFRSKALATINTAEKIAREYRQQGFNLTLRQLYYQFVSRNLISNTERSYSRLSSIISDARLAGVAPRAGAWIETADSTERRKTMSVQKNDIALCSQCNQPTPMEQLTLVNGQLICRRCVERAHSCCEGPTMLLKEDEEHKTGGGRCNGRS